MDLKTTIGSMEELIARSEDRATVSIAELDILTRAASLLCEIHHMADTGQLDGVDLEWMVAADGLIVGEPTR